MNFYEALANAAKNPGVKIKRKHWAPDTFITFDVNAFHMLVDQDNDHYQIDISDVEDDKWEIVENKKWVCVGNIFDALKEAYKGKRFRRKMFKKDIWVWDKNGIYCGRKTKETSDSFYFYKNMVESYDWEVEVDI